MQCWTKNNVSYALFCNRLGVTNGSSFATILANEFIISVAGKLAE
jgi:hypothetical protein